MTASDLTPLLPLIVLAAASVVVMLAIAFYRNYGLAFSLTVAGLVLSLAALPAAAPTAPAKVTALLKVDGYALLYMGLIFASTLAVALLSHGHIRRCPGVSEEYYLLLLLAAFGSAVLVSSVHFASFFIGLEVLSVSLYALIAYRREKTTALEAGLKYLVLAGVSSAFLLFGMALIYFDFGTMGFSEVASRLSSTGAHGAVALAGMALVIVGIGFKLGVVPFHMWTPDVFQGSPAPVTGFLATVSKGAIFALLLRYVPDAGARGYGAVYVVFAVLAIASMFGGNILALLQQNVKRILAYSSIAHMGYLLVAFLSSGTMRVTAVTFYLTAYFVTTLAAFGVVTVLSGQEREAEDIGDYRGLYRRSPWLAGLFTASLLSLAGMPLTAGFVGKFYVVAAGAGSALWGLVLVLIVNSAMGLFYYLRVIIAMYAPEEGAFLERPVALAGGLALAAAAAALILLGVYPGPFIGVIQAMTAGIF